MPRTAKRVKEKTTQSTAPLMKAGLVAIVGRSNVGKSTLLNALVGSKIAIVTPKPQTTRHAIQGVLHDPRGQIVFVDTPGLLNLPRDLLTSKLNETVRETLQGIDAVLYVVDPTRYVGDEEKDIRRLVAAVRQPKFLVLNKSDERGEFRDEYLARADDFNAAFEISARDGKGLRPLIDALFGVLPTSAPLYPPDRITDRDNRFWIEEIIREKLFLAAGEEVPYSATVQVEDVVERENGMIYVRATVLTTAPRYRQMLIGKGGRTIKAIGTAARREIETVTDKRVYLDLQVEVDEHWQERFGEGL